MYIAHEMGETILCRVCWLLTGHFGMRTALIYSVSLFHERAFLPGPFALRSLVMAPATLEAVVDLFIEISCIATCTQRFW